MTKPRIIGIVLIAILGSCVGWQIRNSKIRGPLVDQKATEVLKRVCSLDLTSSWWTVDASGGLVGSPFYSIRWWREYFILKEGDAVAFEALSSELDNRHPRVDFTYLPPTLPALIYPHRYSTNLAYWWQPETNSEPMFHYAIQGDGGVSVFVYGFKKFTNCLLYIHIIER
jgi:hypothetical protein